jgi:CDP-glucose 4,6-dehydratase
MLAAHEAGFWRGRRVLLTGHTGFKGAWMSLWLHSLGADVTGFALAPATHPNLWSVVANGIRSIIGDVRDGAAFGAAVVSTDPEIVIHMAAQALVRESYRDPLGTFATNVMGTANLLQACRALRNLRAVLIVTSDKVYENREAGSAFREADRLGGHDPYSSSKACAELVTASFRDSYYRAGPPVASARAGNVIGGGDWSEDRLIPDCVRALDAGHPVSLRYPDAVRPWQHVLEPVGGYLRFAEALAQTPQGVPAAVNFGPDPRSFCTVREVVEAFSERFGGKPGWTRDAGEHPPEAHALTLSSELAGRALGWHPRLGLAAALAWTADWYRRHRAGEDMLAFSRRQIAEYRGLVEQKK